MNGYKCCVLMIRYSVEITDLPSHSSLALLSLELMTDLGETFIRNIYLGLLRNQRH